MMFKVLFSLWLLPMWLTGCSSVSPPPTVKSTLSPAKKIDQASAKSSKKSVVVPLKSGGNATATYGLDNAPSQFKVQPNTPSVFKVEPITPPVKVEPTTDQALAAATAMPEAINSAATSNQSTLTDATQLQTAMIAPTTMPTATAPAQLQITQEDVATPAGTSPAVVALINQADQNRHAGNYEAAVVVMERALRIDARNPVLTYKLSQLRLKQSKPQLAEELAGKAALLSANDLDLKRKSWLLIAEARQMQGNIQGARAAKTKADSFFGH